MTACEHSPNILTCARCNGASTLLAARRVSGAEFMAWCERHPEYLERPLSEALVAAAVEAPANLRTWAIENAEISANGLRVTYARSDGHKIIGYHTKFATVGKGERAEEVGWRGEQAP